MVASPGLPACLPRRLPTLQRTAQQEPCLTWPCPAPPRPCAHQAAGRIQRRLNLRLWMEHHARAAPRPAPRPASKRERVIAGLGGLPVQAAGWLQARM